MDGLNYTTIIELAQPLAGRRSSALDRCGYHRSITTRYSRALMLIGFLFVVILSVSAQDEKHLDDTVTVKAKYFTTRGPCIQIGSAFYMPIIDAFEVEEVVKGSLPKKVKRIEVRAMSGNVGEVKEGQVYLVQLTPSPDTKTQLEDRAKDEYSWIWVYAAEVKIQKSSK